MFMVTELMLRQSQREKHVVAKNGNIISVKVVDHQGGTTVGYLIE
jgi:hypothetical protein